MHRLAPKVWFVQLITISRLCGGLVFASLAFQPVRPAILIAIYVTAIVSDLLDGYLARRLQVITYFGRVLDLIGDKSLTIISLIYGAACGIDLLPLALIGTREIITLGGRIIIVHGTQLLPTSRLLGGLLAVMVWGNTLFLVLTKQDSRLVRVVNLIYWVASLLSLLTLIHRIYSNFDRIKVALSGES